MMKSAFLKHIDPGRISESEARIFFKELDGGNPQFGRLTPREQAFCINLLAREVDTPRKVQVYLATTPADPLEPDGNNAMAKIFCSIIGPDSIGLLYRCSGIVMDMEMNISYVQAFVIEFRGVNYGIIFIEITLRSNDDLGHAIYLQDYLRQKLERAAIMDSAKSALQRDGFRKLDTFATIADIIREKYPDCSDELLEDNGEAVKFFVARSELYMRERMPEDIARLIYTNYRFREEFKRSQGAVLVDISNIAFKQMKLTGISIAAHINILSLGDCLRIIDEVVPGFIRHHDKGFVNDEGIGVYRVEITDKAGEPFDDATCRELTERLQRTRKEFVSPKVSPGVELIQRKIVPGMLEEERLHKIPMLYMHPHSRSHIKVVIVSSGEFQGYGLPCAMEINRREGYLAAMADTPTIIKYQDGDRAINQEVSILDVWIDFERCFVETKGIHPEEDLFIQIEEAVKRTKGIGGYFRIFDRTSRILRTERLERIEESSEKENLSLPGVKDIFYRLGDKFILNINVSDKEIMTVVRTGLKSAEAFSESKEKPALEGEEVSTDQGDTFYWLAVTFPPRVDLLPSVFSSLDGINVLSFTQVSKDDYTLLLIKASLEKQRQWQPTLDKIRSNLENIEIAP